jgi:hypothetical protein
MTAPAQCATSRSDRSLMTLRAPVTLGAGFSAVVLTLLIATLRHVSAASLWPYDVIIAGGFLFAIAFLFHGAGSEWLAILGGVAAATGAVLAFQRADHRWITWSYLWPVALPVGMGLGALLYALVRRPADRWPASRFAIGGLFLSVTSGVAAEGLFHIGDPSVGFRLRWPPLAILLLLCLAGTVIALVKLFRTSGSQRS